MEQFYVMPDTEIYVIIVDARQTARNFIGLQHGVADSANG